MNPITAIKRAIAECGPLSAFQITKETGLSFAVITPALGSECFYSFPAPLMPMTRLYSLAH
jgi:hypothetical protein